jgi:hypothetical protein
MAAKFDPNIELNPTGLLTMVVVLVFVAFAVVYGIVATGETKPDVVAPVAAP